jgi:phosphonate transport system substrate-binding protein
MISRLICALLACFTINAMADSFIFTAIPDEDETRLRARFDKVADYLAQQLQVEVAYLPVKSYAAAITAFQNNEVQLAWFGGLSGVRARLLVPGSEAIAQGLEDEAFITYFIAHSRTGLQPADSLPEDVGEFTFTFGSKGSTSGRLMPEFYLRGTYNKSPEELFRRVGFSGNHSQTIRLVEAGTYDLGAVNFTVWDAEMEAGNIDPAKVQIIWQTPPYPDYHWTIRGDADQRFGSGFSNRVRQTLLTMEDPGLLESFPRSKFIPAGNSAYDPILKVGKSIGLID